MWKDVVGYENLYEVSDGGYVRSKYRIDCLGRQYKPKLLTGGRFSNNYAFVRLTKNKKSKNELAHRLVALAFLDNPENKPCVNHKNGNKWDNSVHNLEWCTYS